MIHTVQNIFIKLYSTILLFECFEMRLKSMFPGYYVSLTKIFAKIFHILIVIVFIFHATLLHQINKKIRSNSIFAGDTNSRSVTFALDIKLFTRCQINFTELHLIF